MWHVVPSMKSPVALNPVHLTLSYALTAVIRDP